MSLSKWKVICKVEFETTEVPGVDRPLTAVSARREKTSKNTSWRELRGVNFTQHWRQICVAVFDLEQEIDGLRSENEIGCKKIM